MLPEIKTTRINDRWHCRLYCGNRVIDEMACDSSIDIGWVCRELLRWFNKIGDTTDYSHSARVRQNSARPPIGKIWYSNALERERENRKKRE
jgi:hypothetical protein